MVASLTDIATVVEEEIKLHLTITKKVSFSVLFLNLEIVTIIARG
jgi:hypothetical protein